MRSLVLVSALCCSLAAQHDREPERLVPPALQPFEHLIGPWRAHGFLEANKQEGWDEPATWGWIFEKSKMVGMEVTFKDGRYFKQAQLHPTDLNATESAYRWRATTPDDNEAVYEGTLRFGKSMTFQRKTGTVSAPEQFTLQLLHDVRYVIFYEAKKAGTVRKVATVGATRADVRFGAAGKEEQGPKCIVTGAPGTSTVTYNGQTYYVCCSGCAAEFKHDPEKWLKLAKEARKDAGDPKPGAKPTEPKSESKAKGGDSPASSKDEPKKDDSKPASLLQRARLLEKNKKTAEAIKAYEKLVQEFPQSPEAREAAGRIKALKDLMN